MLTTHRRENIWMTFRRICGTDMRICDCKDWKPNVEIIDSALAIAFIHGFQQDDHVDVFNFCPWCGKKLVEVADDS
jgi:hypothetical protein